MNALEIVNEPKKHDDFEGEINLGKLVTSKEVDKIFEALSLAQGEYKPVIKNKFNPHFKSWYADIAAIREAIKEAFFKNGLVAIQSPSVNGRVNIVTRIGHKSGQWIENELSLKSLQDTPQSCGSAITYGQRYGLSALAGVSAEDDEDDDGEGSHGRGKSNTPKNDSKLNEPKSQGFDHSNSEHIGYLNKFLQQSKIALETEKYQKLLSLMTGKSFNELTSVLKQLG